MSYALMIKNADFSANRLGVVQLEETVRCTGISLSGSSLSFDHLGQTSTLIATVAPANTTDTIIWSSGNNDIVTVADGVVTQVGVGTTTVTATCGQHSASCTVTAVNVLNFEKAKLFAVKNSSSATFDYATIYTGDDFGSYCALYNKDVPTPYRVLDDGNNFGYNLYPIPLGKNATTITVTAPNTIYVNHWELNSAEMCTYGQSQSDPNVVSKTLAKLVAKDSSNPYSKTNGLGGWTKTVAEGADSAVFCLFHYDGTVSDEEIAGVTITVS